MPASSILEVVLLAVAALVFLALAASSVLSAKEGERKAARWLLLGAVLLPLPLLLPFLLDFPGRVVLGWMLVGLPAAAALALLLPLRPGAPPADSEPANRHDERDTMFSRAELEPGSARFAEYYARRPENLEPDNRFRSEPGLLSPEAREADRLAFAAVESGFAVEEHLRSLTDGPVSPQREELDPERISRYIRGLATYLGAHSVGFTMLKEQHLYTVGGRREHYGRPVVNDHRYAVALSVEMDYRMTRQGPRAGTVLETARQYLRAAEIAVQIADFIRRLGYGARAHISSHYQVICPLVARDAGLGEIGRMGLLMTPALGPRVRLSVVSTALPLAVDNRRYDPSVIDFCRSCRKCAAVCPSQSIPCGDRAEEDGVRRWKINHESCYTYWCRAGTDCGRCLAVCPYSHPDTAAHNLVRVLIRRSALFRRFAVVMDDLLYGRKPAPLEPAAWQRGGR